MRHQAVIAAGVGAALLFWLLGLASGYFVDPALWPLGFLYPLLTLLLAAASCFIGIIYALGCLGLFVLRKDRRDLAIAVFALIGPAIVVGGPRLLSGYDAFVYRMKSFPQAEYRRLAVDAKAALDERGVQMLSDHLDDEGAISPSLLEPHRILKISHFPLRILNGDERLSVSWGSGLTGGYTVAISDNPDPPTGWADDLRSEGVYNLPVTYIHDSVAVALLP